MGRSVKARGTCALLVIGLFGVSHVVRAQHDGALVPGSYIATYDGNASAAARAAERAGGKVVFNHAASGILFVQSTNAAFESTLSATGAFSSVLPDRWIVPAKDALEIDAPATSIAATPGSSLAGSSPFDAKRLMRQWNIFRTYTDLAWKINQGSPTVKVAILDTGICTHHDDLAGKVDAELSKSFVTETAAETEEPACIGCAAWEDRHGHGTWVASVVSTNNIGIAGVAPNVRLVAVKIADSRDIGSLTALTRGILYAADIGVDVINVSRGFGIHPIAEAPRAVAFLQRMFAHAARQGSLLVIGAGNDGVDLDRSGNAIAIPCENTNGMCIGATTVGDALASYSNHGVSAVTMMAPGGGSPTAPFAETLANQGVLAACSVHSIERDCPTPDTYFRVVGTSFAAPMVSGAAALVLSDNSRLRGKPQQVKAIVVNAADDLGAPGTDNLFSKGRLNTLRAVQ